MAYKRFTRQELHALVWSRPMRDAAAQVGISDVGLKKICVRYDVATPPQGHWQKVLHGRTPPTPPLKSGRLEQVIDIRVDDPVPEIPNAEAERRQPLLDRETDPAFAISVQLAPAALHPMAARVEKILMASKPDDYGCLRCFEANLPFVRVTPGAAPRALALVDALVRAFEARSFKLKPASGGHWDTTAGIVIEGIAMKIGIWENAERRHHVLTEKEKRDLKTYGWSSAPTYDYVGSNQFSIRRSEMETYVKDTARQRVEDRLNELMRVLINKAFDSRHEARRREIAAAEEAARAALRAEIQALKAKETAALERIEASASRWRKAEDLRGFIAAVAALPPTSGDAQAHRTRWLAWASAHVESLDPLVTHPDSAIAVDFEALDRLAVLTGR
ncbi:hypothetical protein [Phenylobacterium sp.]|uniref:hypothetical protein n=1 Tax=Phenylobacterium sp. TaxID=1871053 RepID=UPI0035B1ADA1